MVSSDRTLATVCAAKTAAASRCFTYDGVAYPAKWVRPTLIDEYQRQEGLILTIGNAVNGELRVRP